MAKAIQTLNEIVGGKLGDAVLQRNYRPQYVRKYHTPKAGMVYEFVCVNCGESFTTNFARFPKGKRPLCRACNNLKQGR